MSDPYTPVFRSIWADDDFNELSWQAQWLYLQLLTMPGRTLCGAFEYRPGKLAGRAQAVSKDDIEVIVQELEAGYWIVVDHATEEGLVRSFVRRDSAMSNANVAKGVVRAIEEITSRRLRAVAVHELTRLRLARPELSAWKVDEVNAALNRPSIDVRAEDGGFATVHHIG